MKIGAHVSASGRLDHALDHAKAIGAESVQIFLSGPQMWRAKQPTAEYAETYRTKSAETGIMPTFFH